MGQFIKTTYNDTINNLAQGVKNRLDNNFYKFNDKKPTQVTFYNPSEDKTTFDEATGDVYGQTSQEETSYRYNKIDGVILYGLSKIELDINQDEWGTESSSIEGECTLVGDEFSPYPSAYFKIDYLDTKKKFYFRVTKVNHDTLPNGANCFQLSYKLDLIDRDIEDLVVKHFKVITNNIGTQLRSVVEDCEYDLIERIQGTCDMLREYYMNLFFKSDVQTFVYKFGSERTYFYDDFMIEFMIRNSLMKGGNKYEYVGHQTCLPPSFAIDYDNTIFRAMEKKNTRLHCPKAYAMLIEDPMSLLTIRLEDYYAIAYTDEYGDRITGVLSDPIDTIDIQLIDAIVNNTRFDDTSHRNYYNIILAYLYGDPITDKLVNTVSDINFVSCQELYYNIPLVIYSLEAYALTMLKAKDKKYTP